MRTEQQLQIEALGHLIEADFATDKSCQSVCLLTAQLLEQSDDELMQKLANVARQAYLASTENIPLK